MRLKDLAHINRHVLPETTDPEYSFRYVDIGSVEAGGRIQVPDDRLRFADAPSRARRLAAPGSTIVSTVRTYLRAIARVPETSEPLVFSTGFAVLERKPIADGRYLAYLCQSERFVTDVVSRSAGVSYPAINPGELAAIPVTLPALDEQCRIADFLDAEVDRVDALVVAQREVRRILLQRRAVGVFDAVTGGSLADGSPSKLAWVRSLPVSWQSVKLGHFARMGSGHTPSRSRPEWWVDCRIPWITTGEVSQIRDDRRDVITTTRERISKIGLANSAAEMHPKGNAAKLETQVKINRVVVLQETIRRVADRERHWNRSGSIFFVLWRMVRVVLLGCRAG